MPITYAIGSMNVYCRLAKRWAPLKSILIRNCRRFYDSQESDPYALLSIENTVHRNTNVHTPRTNGVVGQTATSSGMFSVTVSSPRCTT